MKKSNYLSQDFIFESWYVAGWDHEITQEKMVARTLLGQPILLYRDSQDQVVALANKCCHRAAPLSHGRREGDAVRCMYHGMKFDRTGKCIEIPGRNSWRVVKAPLVFFENCTFASLFLYLNRLYK